MSYERNWAPDWKKELKRYLVNLKKTLNLKVVNFYQICKVSIKNKKKHHCIPQKKKTEKQYISERRHKEGFNESSNTNHPSSITYLSDAIGLNPENEFAYLNRGDAYYSLRQYKKAIEDYSKTIELDPENDTVCSNRGLTYSVLEQYEKAVSDYNKAIELAPEDTYNYVYLSRINIITGNYDSALAVITRALYLPINTETEALALYIECVVKKLLGKDTSLSEREFSKIIKNDFTIWWDFSKLDSWLKNADIDDETKALIKEKSNLLATHLG